MSSTISLPSMRAGERPSPASDAIRSPSSAICCITPTRSTATRSPPAITRSRSTARCIAGVIGEPMYVVAIHPETREVIVGRGAELFGHDLSLDEVNWLVDPLAPDAMVWVQCRYRARAVPGTIAAMGDGRIALRLTEPVRAITPGQSAVLYDVDERLLAGGVIS